MDQGDLDSQAANLVVSCNAWAISSFIPLNDRFAFLRTCNPADWDFFATVAAVCVAVNNLARDVSAGAISAERFKDLYAMVASQLRGWHVQGEDAVHDCQQFVKRTMERTEEQKHTRPAQALGLWVLWNVLKREPLDEESGAISAIGEMLSDPLHDWWHPKKT
jgi:hypothetical protein